MSTVAPQRPTADAFIHQILLYAGEDEFVAATVPFVREGLEQGEPVLVVVGPEKIARLRAALGPDANAVELAPMSVVGRNPACIIPAWQDFVDRHPGRGVRGIGEPITDSRRPDEIMECHQHEVLLNVAFSDAAGWSLLCPYDVTTLTDDVIADALRTHPYATDSGGAPTANPDFSAELTAEPLDGSLPPPPDVAVSIGFGRDALNEVRRIVKRLAREAALGPARTADLVLAVNEVATNSLRHGGGHGTLTVWEDGLGALVCEIRDAGWISEPLVGRTAPPKDRFGGRGVWLANQLCDLVQLRSSPSGTTVRLHVRDPAAIGPPRSVRPR